MADKKKKRRRHPKRLLAEATPIIEKIAFQFGRKYKFAYFQPEDIAGEVWIACMAALLHYRPEKGRLENFLRCCARNHILVVRRDRFYPSQKNAELLQRRINIVNAIPLSGGDIPERGRVLAPALQESDPPDLAAEEKEHAAAVREGLPKRIRRDFDRLMEGKDLPGERFEILKNSVEDLNVALKTQHGG